MNDGRKVLSEISGIPKKEIDKIWKEVKENKKLLDSCDFHSFSIEVKPNVGISRWQCVNCKGVVSNQDKNWYQLGIIHERNKNDKDE